MCRKLAALACVAAAFVGGLVVSSPARSGEDVQPAQVIKVDNQCMGAPVFFELGALDLDGDGEVTAMDLALVEWDPRAISPDWPSVDVAGVPEGDLAERMGKLGGPDSVTMDKLRGIYDGIDGQSCARAKSYSLQTMNERRCILQLARRLIKAVLEPPEGSGPVLGVVLSNWDGRHVSIAGGVDDEEFVEDIRRGRPWFRRLEHNYQMWTHDPTITAARVVK